MPRASKASKSTIRRPAPALTPEDREDQMISLAIDLAEKQLVEGTASAMVIAHYLKLGSTKERLEREKLREENKLIRAKTESLESTKRVEELYKNALDAMRSYTGDHSNTSEEPEDD